MGFGGSLGGAIGGAASSISNKVLPAPVKKIISPVTKPVMGGTARPSVGVNRAGVRTDPYEVGNVETYSGLGYKPIPGSLGQSNIPFGTPNYTTMLNKTGTNWADPKAMGITNTYDPKYLNQLGTYATSTKASPWLQMMQSNIGNQATQAYETQARARMGGLSTAQDQMAMRGGMQSGAMAGLQRSSLRDLMLQRQGVGMERNQALNQAGIAEQESKLAALQALPGMEQNRATMAANIQQQNLSNLLNERKAQYAAGSDTFKTLMQGWGAEKTAQGIAASKPGGMFEGILDVGSWF